MQFFHGRFRGKTQPIGLVWGTLDIREVRYNGKPASPGEKADYIRRNAMNEELIELGWWAGSAAYPKPAFYSFTYPQPPGIERSKVSPAVRDGILKWASSSLITTICVNRKTLTAIYCRSFSRRIKPVRSWQVGTQT